jgi:hypothetical protein
MHSEVSFVPRNVPADEMTAPQPGRSERRAKENRYEVDSNDFG